ncbi:hypothetical protein K2173_021428 [Erythroxylum novogranatense]|uniref:Uncharacterized protein n=1 Tax=Erythroxylum novogranatense TaxID=1862640 RepID=A0AAV8TUZ8_9ROSI|nr:hypothetical protein K2173_021428 [Erythroxylum novogranatense]
MNAQARKETTSVNAQGEVEKRVETIDYSSSAGKLEEVRNVEVIHQPHQPNSNTRGGVLANAAASVASSLQSAKEAISRK